MPGPKTPHPNGIDTHFAGNVGALRIAAQYSNQNERAIRTRVRQHTGTVTLVSGTHTDTDSQPNVNETLYSWETRTVLTTSDVGPSAGL